MSELSDLCRAAAEVYGEDITTVPPRYLAQIFGASMIGMDLGDLLPQDIATCDRLRALIIRCWSAPTDRDRMAAYAALGRGFSQCAHDHLLPLVEDEYGEQWADLHPEPNEHEAADMRDRARDIAREMGS